MPSLSASASRVRLTLPSIEFSIASGELLYRFFGNYTALSDKSKMFAVENLPGRVTMFDLTNGREIERLSFARPVTRMNFLEDGKRFFVLTEDQSVFMFDTGKFGTESRLATR